MTNLKMGDMLQLTLLMLQTTFQIDRTNTSPEICVFYENIWTYEQKDGGKLNVPVALSGCMKTWIIMPQYTEIFLITLSISNSHAAFLLMTYRYINKQTRNS